MKRLHLTQSIHLTQTADVTERLRSIAVKVGVGMVSINRQYESWPTRTRFYRRHLIETKLSGSDTGRNRRLA